MAAFYLTNEEWEQGEEIPLIAMEPSSREMQNISVNDIFQNTEKLLYVNDFLTLWRFMIEVEEIDEIKKLKRLKSCYHLVKCLIKRQQFSSFLMRKAILKTKMFTAIH